MEGERKRSRTFHRKADADAFDVDLKRRQRLGTVAHIDAGAQTLDAYMRETWIPGHGATLTAKTRKGYATLYRLHLAPDLGGLPLRAITPRVVRDWQARHLAQGAAPVATRKALTLLGGILQLAAEDELIEANPVRVVKKAPIPRAEEIRPLAPTTVEAIRAALLHPQPVRVAHSSPGKRTRRSFTQEAPGTPQTRLRDATLVSVLAYAGLRPGEALALKWADIGDQTILVYATKTDTKRTVKLLAPLASDLREWHMAAGRPGRQALVFPDVDLDNWRSRNWSRATEAADARGARIYDLRHSFASLLIAEGRSVIYVARQLGHGAELTLGTYGHVIDELDGVDRVHAETAIWTARSISRTHEGPMAV